MIFHIFVKRLVLGQKSRVGQYQFIKAYLITQLGNTQMLSVEVDVNTTSFHFQLMIDRQARLMLLFDRCCFQLFHREVEATVYGSNSSPTLKQAAAGASEERAAAAKQSRACLKIRQLLCCYCLFERTGREQKQRHTGRTQRKKTLIMTIFASFQISKLLGKTLDTYQVQLWKKSTKNEFISVEN